MKLLLLISPLLRLCCECGVVISPNPSNRCLACVRSRFSIAEKIPQSGVLNFCQSCERYLEPPSTWTKASLESKDLLRVCLKKLKGLNQLKMVDAGFIWTEPHSKRIKVKLVVQEEVISGAVLQQEFITEFTVQNHMCEDCHKVEAKNFWKAVVQVRQKTTHKRTFYYLEQLLLKHKMHEQTLGIKSASGGLDFYYPNEQSARRLLDFLTSVVACRWAKSRKLISHDIHSNTHENKYSFSVEIVPVCKDSIVCLPSKVAHQLGGISKVCLVQRVTSSIFFIDPCTAQRAEMNGDAYWRNPFNALCSFKTACEFVVIDVADAEVKKFKGQGQLSKNHDVSEVWVQKASELGVGESIFCRSHLGRHLNPGSTVLGYDIRNINQNDENFEKLKDSEIPDVILVKKVPADRRASRKRRKWRLKHLGVEDDLNSQNRDYNDFLDDLEEDPQLRANINIYRDPDKDTVSEAPSDVDDFPTISIDEMLSDLKVEDLDEETPSGASAS